MAELASDDFEREDATELGANWGIQSGSGGIHLVDGEASASASVGSLEIQYYSAEDAPDDGYAEIVVGSVLETASDNGIGPAYRVKTDSLTMYFAQTNAQETRLYRFDSQDGSLSFTFEDGPPCAPGDTLRITCEGTSISVQKNGTTIITMTDSTITSGRAGMFACRAQKQATAASWAFGDLTSSSTSVEVGQTQETDAAFLVRALKKKKSAGLLSETDSALTATVLRAFGVSLESETDSASAAYVTKSQTVGLNSESDSVFALGLGRTIPVGQAAETDTAFSLSKLKKFVVGVATEIDAALSLQGKQVGPSVVKTLRRAATYVRVLLRRG